MNLAPAYLGMPVRFCLVAMKALLCYDEPGSPTAVPEEERRIMKNKLMPWIGLAIVVLLIAGALYVLFGPR